MGLLRSRTLREEISQVRLHPNAKLTPADMFTGRQQEVMAKRERIKRETLARRKRENSRRAA